MEEIKKSKPLPKVFVGYGWKLEEEKESYHKSYVWEDHPISGSVVMKYPEKQGVRDIGLIQEAVSIMERDWKKSDLIIQHKERWEFEGVTKKGLSEIGDKIRNN